MNALLEARGLDAGYGLVHVLRGIDLHVDPGEVVVVLGANGAGKTTLMRTLSGLLPYRGEVVIDGSAHSSLAPEHLVRRGISLIPQGRGTITALTVEDNLRIGAITRKDSAAVEADIAGWYDTFPRLGERRTQPAGTLSGGEQQMLAMARAMMSRPRLLMCDEASLGLAPIITRQIFDQLRTVNDQDDVALLLVEQNAALALDLADRVYLMSVGEIVTQGPASDFANDEAIRAAYLGGTI